MVGMRLSSSQSLVPRSAIVIRYVAVVSRVGPGRLGSAVARRSLPGALVDVGGIPAFRGVIGQLAPRQRNQPLATRVRDRQHHVSDLSARPIKYQGGDAAQVMTLWVEYR